MRVGSNLDHPLQRSGISRGSSTRHIMLERGIDGRGCSGRTGMRRLGNKKEVK